MKIRKKLVTADVKVDEEESSTKQKESDRWRRRKREKIYKERKSE